MLVGIPSILQRGVQCTKVVGDTAVDPRNGATVTLLLLETFRRHLITAHHRLDRAASREHQSRQ
ncbi:hypothetical protein D3C86_2107370 [compost metagenome]